MLSVLNEDVWGLWLGDNFCSARRGSRDGARIKGWSPPNPVGVSHAVQATDDARIRLTDVTRTHEYD